MKKIVISTVAALMLLSSNVIASKASKAASSEAVSKAKIEAQKRKGDVKIIQEAVEVVALTHKVLSVIEEGKKR